MSRFSGTILVSVLFCAVFMPVCSAKTAGGQVNTRIVHFPKDRSMGKLKVLESSPENGCRLDAGGDKWEYLCEAVGDVTVPADKRLMLIVSWDGLKDLSPLARLRPDDLYALTVSENPESPPANPDETIMPHLGGLTGLRELTLNTNITYNGLRFIKNLTTLTQLGIWSRRFGNRGLARLGEFKSLEAVSLSCGGITDAGLRHLAALPSLSQLRVWGKPVWEELLQGPFKKIDGLWVPMEVEIEGGRTTRGGDLFMWCLLTTFCRKVTIMRNVRRKITLGILLCLVCVPLCIGQTNKVLSGRDLLKAMRGEDIPSASTLLDRYTQALDSTESFIGSYELVQESSYYIPGRSPRFTGKVYGRGQNRSDGQRIYSQAYRWGDVSAKLRNLPKDTPHYNLRVNDGKILYTHARSVGNARSSGYVSRHDKGPEKAVFILSANASILGFFGTDERLDSVLRQAHQIAVRPKTETVGGSECYVIDARTKYGKYSIWLDPEHGYHPVKVNAKATEGDVHSYKRVLSKGQVKLEYLKNVRFEKIDGIWVPMEADRGIHNTVEPESFVKDDTHFKRTKVVLNPDHDKLGSFDDPLENPAQDPELVNGTRMTLVSGMRHTWQDGKVVDAQGREVDLDALKPKEPVSLVGKPLPSLVQFGAKFDSAEVEGKRILVCFWDMNQRPSRNCVQRLNRRAKVLARKGVFVVLVHAARAEKGKLEAWLAKRKIALPVGRIEGDVQKVLRNWGVWSLPWLILADPKHVVTAEGFGLNELNEKIKEASGS